MSILFYTLHIVVCIFLILVVLLQQGKGADLSVFGGGATMTAFGARGAASVFHKLTVISFVIFMVTTIGIGVVESGESGRSVVGDEAPVAVPAEAEEAGEVDATPTAIPALPEEEPAEEPAALEGAGESGVEDGAAAGEAGAPGSVEAPDPAAAAPVEDGGAADAG